MWRGKRGREGWTIVSLGEQLYAFGMTIAGGVAMGVLFDLFRVVRDGVGPRGGLAQALDVLYWVVATPFMIGLLWRANYGELRFYVVLGVLVGSLLYNAAVSVYVVEGLAAVWYGGGRLLLWLLHVAAAVVTAPVLAVRALVIGRRLRRAGGRARAWRPGWRPPLAWRRR